MVDAYYYRAGGLSTDIATTTFGPLEKYVAVNDNKVGGAMPALSDEDWARHAEETAFEAAPVAKKPAYIEDDPGYQEFERLANEQGVQYARPASTDSGQPERQGSFMQVYSGRKFWPLSPEPDEIFIEDIAHSLSLQCRYAGHCLRFYSVAEHCVHLAYWLLRNYGPQTALHGLLHDASEAYLIDVPRPVKPFLPGYKEAEARVMAAVAERFGLAKEMPAAVKDADDRIIADELVNLKPMDWHKNHDNPLGVRIGCWSPEVAEDEFLTMFVMLQKRLEGSA